MRINVYSQELTDEVVRVEKISNTGRPYVAAQLILHSSPMLHHPPQDDDRSAVTFWLPSSASRLESMAQAFERIAAIFRGAQAHARTQVAPDHEQDTEADEATTFMGLAPDVRRRMWQVAMTPEPSAPSSPPSSGGTSAGGA